MSASYIKPPFTRTQIEPVCSSGTLLRDFWDLLCRTRVSFSRSTSIRLPIRGQIITSYSAPWTRLREAQLSSSLGWPCAPSYCYYPWHIMDQFLYSEQPSRSTYTRRQGATWPSDICLSLLDSTGKLEARSTICIQFLLRISVRFNCRSSWPS